MSVTTALARGRTAAEALMTDTCTISRRTGEATDPNTGQITPTYAGVYTGKCRFQQRSAASRETDVGEATLLLRRMELQLPMAVTGVQVDDVVTADASVLDPDLPGRQFVVRDLAHGTHKTARRIGIQEATS